MIIKHFMKQLHLISDVISVSLILLCSCSDQSGYLLCGVCPLQCRVGDVVSGALEEARGRAGLQVGHSGHSCRVLRGAQATVQGEDCC